MHPSDPTIAAIKKIDIIAKERSSLPCRAAHAPSVYQFVEGHQPKKCRRKPTFSHTRCNDNPC
jgi:hypothetical protein